MAGPKFTFEPMNRLSTAAMRRLVARRQEAMTICLPAHGQIETTETYVLYQLPSDWWTAGTFATHAEVT